MWQSRLVPRIAEALEALHESGILHRDIKPANVVFANEAAPVVRIVDFGIAYDTQARTVLTQTGATIGTPAYMAPEQLRGETATPASDVYAAATLFFELAAGRPPFIADSAFAVIGRILLEAAPSIAQFVPTVPQALSEGVARALVKVPTVRPTMSELAALLRRHAEIAGDSATVHAVAHAVHAAGDLTREESTSAVLVARSADPRTVLGLIPTAAAHDVLPDGTVLALFSDPRSVDAPLLKAVRAGLAILDSSPEATVVVSAGKADTRSGSVAGEALQRAGSVQPVTSGLFVDGDTASVLESRFVLAWTGNWAALVAERPTHGQRLLLGKPTPMVGRHAELAQLEALVDALVDDGAPRVALVGGPPGQGKSRLRHELIERLRARPEPIPDLVLRFEPVSENSPWAALGHALRAEVAAASGGTARREGAIEYANARGLDETQTAFLLHVLGYAGPEEESVISLARATPDGLRDGVRGACRTVAHAMAAGRALVVVLEDAHWADRPTLELARFLLSDDSLPMALIAFSRLREDRDLADLAGNHSLVRIALGRLAKRAASGLVAASLPDSAPDDVVDQIVHLADGSPLVLEELVRAYAATGSVTATASARQVFEARLGRLDAPTRLVARAAAVIGEVFWREAIEAVLAGTGTDVQKALAALEREEVVTARSASRFSGTSEFVFRHALLRDAADAALPPQAKRAMHAAVAAWFARSAEADLAAIAHHASEGGLETMAGETLARAGYIAAAASDPGTAVRALEDALRYLPRHHAECGAIHAALEEIYRSMSHERSRLRHLAHLRRLARSLQSASSSLVANIRQARYYFDKADKARGMFFATSTIEAAIRAGDAAREAEARVFVARVLRDAGSISDALSALDQVAPTVESLPVPLRAEYYRIRGTIERRCGRIAEATQTYRRATSLFDAGQVGLAFILNSLGYALFVDMQLGESRELFQRALGILERAGFRRERGKIRANLGNVCLGAGDWAGAARHFDQAVQHHRDDADLDGLADTFSLRARAAILLDDEANARSNAAEALEHAERSGDTYDRAHVLLVSGWLARRFGSASEALGAFAEAVRTAESTEMVLFDAITRAEYAQACLVAGDGASARTNAIAALDVLRANTVEWSTEAYASAVDVLATLHAPEWPAALDQAMNYVARARTKIGDVGLLAQYDARADVRELRAKRT